MLSIEPPCNASELRADERASDQLPLQEEDPASLGESQAPNFSIRDYVFTSRSKDITTNWPFPQQFLQLCLNHGVKDVLPPFEPPDSVRTRCCIKAVGSEQQVACPGDEKVSLQFESVEIEDVGLVEEEPLKAPVDQGDTLVDESIEGNHDQTERISDQISERHPSEKKCRLIVKYGAITESSRVEDIVSTSSTVSDSMASKVCPVCKTFASTSNTTLNAHIDQCLSTESSTKWLVSEILKPKGKPRKKRLMVDIYTTAAHCTLEDLDRRNGTNWVTELAFVAPTNEACTAIKRPKLPVVTRDDGHEEAVYVDSNGIKLRILSKFNDTPPSSLTRENFKMKKHADHIKEGENLVVSSKKCFESKYSKCMKVKPQTKKLSSFSLFNSEIQAAPGSNHHADTPQEEEGSPLEMSNDLEQIKIGTSTTLRNWVGSKRSDLPKKLNNKDIHNLGNPVLKTTDVGNLSAVKSDFRKLSRPSEDTASFPKAKSVGFLSSTTQTMDNVNENSPKPSVVNSKWSSDGTSTNHLVLKIPRSPMKPSKSCHPSLKIKKSSTMKNSTVTRKPCFSLERSKGDANEKPSTSKMFRKQRSISGSTKQRELTPDVDGGLRRSVEHCGINTARTSKKVRTHRSDLSENFKTSRLDDASTIEKPKYTSLKRRHPRIESHDPEIATCDMQVEALTCEDIISSGEPVNHDTAVSENLGPTSIAKLDPRPSVEKNVDSVCGTEAHTEPMAEKLRGEQEIQYCHVTPDEVVSQRIQSTDEVEFRGEVETCAAQYTKYQAETASFQESSACLTSHGDASDQDQNPAIDRERQGSPVSTASTISPRSTKDPEYKDSDAEAMMKHTVDNTEGRNKGSRNEEGKVFPPAKEPERYSDDQPCCCSRREGLPRESQFFRQNVMAGMMLPSKGMQISNLKLVPSISSSFSSYPSSRTDLISPTGSITTKASTESAVTVPGFIDFGSPSPSPRNQAHSPSSSILRLMGKNLMVTNTEEFQLPTAHHPASEIPSSTQCFPRPSSASTGWESFSYHQQQQLPGGSVFFGRTPPMVNRHMALHSTDMRVGGFVSPMQASFKMKPDQQIHQQVSKKPNSHQHHQKPVSSYQVDMAREVIVIDDSPEFEVEHKYIPVSNPMQQRPFSCFPPQGQFISRGYPNTIKRGKASDGSDPLLQRPFVFQSPPTGHLKPPVYYFQTLR